MSVLRGDDPAAVASAAAELAAGGLVAFPTETVYGLGARADDDAAVAAIFRTKGRPADHPLIVHVAERTQAEAFVDGPWPEAAERLVAAFWPGPLTVIVRRRAGMAEAAAGGHPTIGLRCPDHPVALALLRAAAARGVPGLAGPSANRFGRVSPTRAAHVADEFGAGLTVLDGGDCAVGIESAIVDCSRAEPMLLRPGALGHDRLAAALGRPLARLPAAAAPAAADVPRAPGLLASHYAPDARLRLFAPDGAALEAAVAALCRGETGAGLRPQDVAVYSRGAAAGPPAAAEPPRRRMPDEPGAAAHELFAVLRDLDAAGVREIWVQAPPDGDAWDGVRDRLRRAAVPVAAPADAPPSPGPLRPPLDPR